MFSKQFSILLLGFILVLSGCEKTQESVQTDKNMTSKGTQTAQELVIYSSRNEQLIVPLIKAYQDKTGVDVRFVTDKPEPLIEKIKAEGEQTPADILMTVDAGNLWRASQAGLFQAVNSPILDKAIPAEFRAKNNEWFGFSQRARTIVYSTERVKPEQLSTYEDLANEAWKDKLCLRTSKKIYNQSLVAMLIAKHGVEKTENLMKSLVANLATDPFSNDTKTMQAILAGQCDVAIVNSYYFGRMQKKTPKLALKLFWPNQNPEVDQLAGVHVNISGAGVLKHAKNPDTAIDFLQWMAGVEAQSILAKGNMEYPVVAKAEKDLLVSSWGLFKADSQNLTKAGELQAEAVKLMDRVGYR